MTKISYEKLGVGSLAALLVLTSFGAGAYGAMVATSGQLSASVAQNSFVQLDPSELTAKAAVLYDLKSGVVLYQKNANEQLPLASLTKLMAAETVLSQKSIDTPVEITKANLLPEGDSGLRVGEVVMLGDLLKLALVASSNDAMEAAAHSLGSDPITKMNEAASGLGLTKMHFFNATGLDVSKTTGGAYGSAYDVARLAAAIYKAHPSLFELTTHAKVAIESSDGGVTAAATTLPLQSIPGFVAAKTGYTDLAGGNLVAVFDLEPGQTVVAAVLGSTRDARFSDIKILLEAARLSLTL